MQSRSCVDTPVEATGYVEAMPLDLGMSDAALRLVSACACPSTPKILGPGIVREIADRRAGPQAPAARDGRTTGAATRQRRASLDRFALRRAIQRNAHGREVGMSVSAFHHQFRRSTASLPGGLEIGALAQGARADRGPVPGAAVAAAAVGYESVLQFSREFKRFFGEVELEEGPDACARLFIVAGAASTDSLSCSAELQHRQDRDRFWSGSAARAVNRTMSET